MLCQNCKTENQRTDMYCMSCGMPLEMDFDSVRSDMQEEIIGQRSENTSNQLQHWLYMAIFLLLLAAIFDLYARTGLKDEKYVPFIDDPVFKVTDHNAKAVPILPNIDVPDHEPVITTE